MDNVDELHSETSERKGVSEEDRDGLLLVLMLSDGSGYPWSVDELVRVIGDRLGVIDAVARLQERGLLHRLGEFVFPTVAARRADELRS
ncbi:MAG TPA: hypothetical protein VIJ39_14560 [Solirubrobacteraceae bacterium]